MQRARHLDPDALAQIHQLYYPVIYRYIRFRLDDEVVVEDLVSEVFVRLFEELKKRRGPNQNLRGWLLGTASHLVIDHHRWRYRSKEQPLNQSIENQVPDPSLPETDVETRAVQCEVRQAIRKLTNDQQHVLALRFGDGFSLEQTADLMEKNVNAIKALQFRALSSLRRILAEDKTIG